MSLGVHILAAKLKSGESLKKIACENYMMIGGAKVHL